MKGCTTTLSHIGALSFRHICLCLSSVTSRPPSRLRGHSRSIACLLLILPASNCSPTQFAIKTKFRALKPEGRWVSAQEKCCLATGGRFSRVYLSSRWWCEEGVRLWQRCILVCSYQTLWWQQQLFSNCCFMWQKENFLISLRKPYPIRRTDKSVPHHRLQFECVLMNKTADVQRSVLSCAHDREFHLHLFSALQL